MRFCSAPGFQFCITTPQIRVFAIETLALDGFSNRICFCPLLSLYAPAACRHLVLPNGCRLVNAHDTKRAPHSRYSSSAIRLFALTGRNDLSHRPAQHRRNASQSPYDTIMLTHLPEPFCLPRYDSSSPRFPREKKNHTNQLCLADSPMLPNSIQRKLNHDYPC